MDYEIISQQGLDRDRGIALLVAGAVMILLKWVLPAVAPLAVLAYAVYRLVDKRYKEAAVFAAIAIGLWFLRMPLGWMLWLFGFLMVGFGVFYLLRSFRGQYLTH